MYLDNPIYKFLFINSIVALIIIILERRRPEKTIAWLIIFLAFPPIGLIFYIFVGRNWKKNKLNDEKFDIAEELAESYKKEFVDNKYYELMRLLRNNSSSPIFYKNKIKIFNNGEEKFKELKKQLLNAKHHIHLEYYIFKSDTIGKEIIQILEKKAKEGLEVRVILDKVGSLKFNKKQVKRLKKAGVDIVFYTYFLAPLFRFINTQINYRNHRKIAVIDGKTGFVGGINIGDEYLGRGKLGFWRDTHIMIKGDCVLGLQAIFIHDFCMIKKVFKSDFLYRGYIEDYFPEFKERGTIMQIAKSGPDSENPAIMQAIIMMIGKARKHIYITTPYFVPTESVMMALKIAALGGIEIKILFPGKYDHLNVYYASRTYLSELVNYGIRIYFYDNNSFIHSKVITVDGDIGMIGTANMDIRSFELNYEISTVIYDHSIISMLEKNFFHDLAKSDIVNKEDFNNVSFIKKFLEAIARMFSNLL